MTVLLDMVKESVVALAEQPEEHRIASDWLKVKDQPRWERIADGVIAQLITNRGSICANDAVWQFRDRVWREARALWVSQLSQEHFDAAMTLFGAGVIHVFKAPYGEEFDCFEFDSIWSEFRGCDDSDKPEKS